MMGPNYRREFEKERQRLAQLWDAYELQGAEMEKLQRHVEQLEYTIYEKDKRIAAAEEAMKNTKSGNVQGETDLIEANHKLRDVQLENQLLTDNLRDQQEQFSSLFNMNQELAEELEALRAEIQERDRLISQLKTMLESKDEQIEFLRPR
jgi:chromosome segregation ATPase